MTVEVGVLYIQTEGALYIQHSYFYRHERTDTDISTYIRFCCTFMLSQNQLITGGDRPREHCIEGTTESYVCRDVSVCAFMTVEVGVLYIQCSLGLSPPVIR
jgi:hypothetical protein